MSKSLLTDHLLIEFLNDPDFDRNSVHSDVNDVFEIWRKKAGRHYGVDQASLAFTTSCFKQFDRHLFRDGKRIPYRLFLQKLAEG